MTDTIAIGSQAGRSKTSTTQFMTVNELAGRLHMAVEGLKKKPGLMKSGVGYLKLVEDYVQAVADAHKDGKLVVLHGTQCPPRSSTPWISCRSSTSCTPWC